MKGMSGLFLKVYSTLLRLYPDSFRREFEEQMLLDFSDLAKDAAQRSRFSLLLFCLRELVDFPISLLQAHLKEGGLFIRLRAEPLNTAWRGALVFGLAFGLGDWLHALVFWFEANIKTSLPHKIQFLFERFLLDWMGDVLTAIAFGILFAFLFTNRSKFFHYLLIGALGWLLQLVTTSFVEYFFDYWTPLNGQERLYLHNLRAILNGAIIGLIFVMAQSERRKDVHLLAAYVVAYPVLTYLYVEQVFTASWSFIALAILRLALIAGIFILSSSYAPNRHAIQLVVAGAVGSVILRFLIGIPTSILLPPVPPEGFLYQNPLFWPVILLFMAASVLYGILLGFLLGWIGGSQNTDDLQKIAV